jgi:hypothetical protein
MKLENIYKLKLNNFQINTPKKPVNLADYPWDECVADQTEKYGDEETAKKVCGAIKAMYAAKQKMDIEPNPCWAGYEPYGLKDDGSPNCIPVKEEQSKQDFVIPKPEANEAEDKYISRCMSAISSEYDTQEQALAVCYAQLEK